MDLQAFTNFGLFEPGLDISETDTEVTVTTKVPGYDPDKVDVEISDNKITINGEMKEEEEEEKEGYHYKETRSGSFHREMTLPAAVDASKATASMKDDVLTVTLPKGEGEDESVKVEIGS